MEALSKFRVPSSQTTLTCVKLTEKLFYFDALGAFHNEMSGPGFQLLCMEVKYTEVR